MTSKNFSEEAHKFERHTLQVKEPHKCLGKTSKSLKSRISAEFLAQVPLKLSKHSFYTPQNLTFNRKSSFLLQFEWKLVKHSITRSSPSDPRYNKQTYRQIYLFFAFSFKKSGLKSRWYFHLKRKKMFSNKFSNIWSDLKKTGWWRSVVAAISKLSSSLLHTIGQWVTKSALIAPSF